MTATKDLIARSSIVVNAPPTKVWEALVSPAALKQYMFGSDVRSDFKEGSPITFSGEWQGKSYQDKGSILKAERNSVLQYSHFSSMSGKPDRPENYHTVTIELSDLGGNRTRVQLTQDNNQNEAERAHSEKNWNMMLTGLKKFVEGSAQQR